MPYDAKTVLDRYQQLLEVPEGEPTESFCALRSATPGVAHETLGCEPGNCGSCCVGVVESVRQYAEQQASLETRAIEFDDTMTKAQKLNQD
jgi:ferredoxin